MELHEKRSRLAMISYRNSLSLFSTSSVSIHFSMLNLASCIAVVTSSNPCFTFW